MKSRVRVIGPLFAENAPRQTCWGVEDDDECFNYYHTRARARLEANYLNGRGRPYTHPVTHGSAEGRER